MPAAFRQRLQQADGLGEANFGVAGVVQPVQRRLHFRPEFTPVLGEERRAQGGHHVIVKLVQPVRAVTQGRAARRKSWKPNGSGRGQKREQRPLVLGELPEERPEDERGQRVQRVAGGETFLKFVGLPSSRTARRGPSRPGRWPWPACVAASVVGVLPVVADGVGHAAAGVARSAPRTPRPRTGPAPWPIPPAAPGSCVRRSGPRPGAGW